LIIAIIFFIDSIDFLGGPALKEIRIKLAVNDSQGKQLPWRSILFSRRLSTLKKTNLLGGYWPSRKLLSLAVTTFHWSFGKLSLVVVSLAASLQGNHP
jgi:hypothetical protein